MGGKGHGTVTGDGEKETMKKGHKVSAVKYQVFPFCIWLVLLSFIPGCGYTTRSMISNKYRNIYIVPFINNVNFTQETSAADKYKIYRPMLETEITKAVIDKFIFDGNLKLKEKDSADLVLKGELVEFRKDPLRYSENSDIIDEYRMNLIVDISLWDNRENRLIWEEKRFTGDFTYFPTASTLANVTKKTDDQAVVDAVKDLARRIVERTVEQW